VLVCGGIGAAVVAGTQGPSATAVRAQKAKVAAATAAYEAAARRETQSQLVSHVTVSPHRGASGVALNTPVSITSGFGSISAVVVHDKAGNLLPGTLNADHTQWLAAGTLAATSHYFVTATVKSTGGVSAEVNTDFTTLTPTSTVTATAYPSTGSVVGVGQPIVIEFDQGITSAAEQQTVLSRFTVTESKPVPGGWHWFSTTELHFRPETFWPAGERVTITGSLGGWSAGSGVWGSGQISESFAVGDARVSYADLASDEMTVTLNGRTIASYPISGGRPEYPTMDGIHVVLDKEPVVHMVSSTVGIPVNSPNGYDEYVYNDVHISDSGEYVHAAPWSVYAQGVENVSHGCINLGPSNSLDFYNFSETGDVVEVTGSPRPPDLGDHGTMDWNTPWSQWTPGRVVSAATPATTTTTTTVTPAVAASATSSAQGAPPSSTTKAEPSPTTSW
jgi:lipoprotein-anchoring transpeptidase ErfK/SrfK